MKIPLLKPHTHSGVAYAVGAEINVLAHDAKWLIARGVAAPEPAVKPKGKKPPDQPEQTSTTEQMQTTTGAES